MSVIMTVFGWPEQAG
uniref:Uncharacterized protein n=1 Tax=Arundo donax TaxID=35708 RepID=A0A0A9HLU9_ARUDO